MASTPRVAASSWACIAPPEIALRKSESLLDAGAVCPRLQNGRWRGNGSCPVKRVSVLLIRPPARTDWVAPVPRFK
jgi:hypothetical protein